MVFHKDHTPHEQGRAAIQAVLEARVNPALFASGEMERLIVASGGNLRNLFSMTSNACDSATLRGASQVEAAAFRGNIPAFGSRLGLVVHGQTRA